MQRAEFGVQHVVLGRCVLPKDAVVEFDLDVLAWILCHGWLRDGCGCGCLARCATCIWVSGTESELAASRDPSVDKGPWWAAPRAMST